MDDRRDRIEEGEGAFAGLGSYRFGKPRARQRPGGDNGGMARQRVDAFPNDGDVRMLLDSARDLSGEGFAIDRERGSGGHAMGVGGAHDQ